MIIARLQGGLGNQMFQYAAAKSLASHHKVPFKLEAITSLNKDRKRELSLSAFDAPFSIASPHEVKKFIPIPKLYRHIPAIFRAMTKNIYAEKHFHFDPAFFELGSEIFIDGFWQSPKYFEKIQEEIRRDFVIKKEFITHLSNKISELHAVNSIGVHIRRGDLLNPKTAAFHGVLPREYYYKGIELLSKEMQDPFFYFFSDDVEWVRSNIDLPNRSEIISLSSIEDFYLLSNCRNNIIANSSFSWWAGWLNANSRKTVVAPKHWFAVTSINTSDLIPPNWIRI